MRIDFNWTNSATNFVSPGGSPSPAVASVRYDPADGNYDAPFAVLWTGNVIPKFSQTYTFTVTVAGQEQLYIRPQGAASWTTLVNQWTGTDQPLGTQNQATYAMIAGRTYDIELQYAQVAAGDPAECKLHWSSSSTPDEAIEPAEYVGLNQCNGDACFANLINGATRYTWWQSNGSQTPAVPVDSNGWPTADTCIYLGEGDDTLSAGGTYLIQFQGTASLGQDGGDFSTVVFYVGTHYYGAGLPAGAGYNAATNTTTATMVVSNASPSEGLFLAFNNTSRDGNVANPEHNGITNLYVMQPTTLGGSTDPQPGELFTASAWPRPRSTPRCG